MPRKMIILLIVYNQVVKSKIIYIYTLEKILQWSIYLPGPADLVEVHILHKKNNKQKDLF